MDSFKMAFILCFVYVASSNVTSRKPCVFKVTGMFKNVTVSPNPPEVERTCRVTGELHATRDIQLLFVRGYVMNEETGFKFPLGGEVCDISEYFCPIDKGDIRHVNVSYYFDQVWPTNVPFGLVANFLMEDDTQIAQISFHDCRIVKPDDGLTSSTNDAKTVHKAFKIRYGNN